MPDTTETALVITVGDGPVEEIVGSRLSWRIGAVLGLVVMGLLLAPVVFGDEPVVVGSQRAGVSPKFRSAAAGGWVQLTNAVAEERPGFPEPMARHAEEICVGFGRVDFAPEERQPSLARCLPGGLGEPLEANEIVVLATVLAGPDVWHFVEAAGEIERVRVDSTSGPVDSGRVYVAGSTFALRLERGQDVARVEWTVLRVRYRCTSDPVAWATADFCVAASP